MILQSRRSLIVGMASLLAAPAIVRVSSLMPVKVIEDDIMMRLLTDHYVRFAKNFYHLMQTAEDDLFAVTGLSVNHIGYNNDAFKVTQIGLNFLKDT